MKPHLLFLGLFLLTETYVYAQAISPKDQAIDIAKNDFSSNISMRKEKYGVVREKHKVIESTLVVANTLQFYTGNYIFEEIQYQLEIRLDEQNNPIVTLSAPNQPGIHMKNVTIADAYFVGFVPKTDGSDEKWEGVFINKSHDNNTTFGLGIKLPTAIPLGDSIELSKLFFRKVLP
jgi:hypothetical protein